MTLSELTTPAEKPENMVTNRVKNRSLYKSHPIEDDSVRSLFILIAIRMLIEMEMGDKN